jgi:hypothetical protein
MFHSHRLNQKYLITFTANLVLIAGISISALANELPIIQEVVITKAGKGARIEIRADKPIKFTSYYMPELTKWVIDIPNSVPALAEESKKVVTVPLERVTVKKREINGVPFSRIGLDITGEAEFTVKTDTLEKGVLTVFLHSAVKGAEIKRLPATGRSVVTR